MAVPLKVKIVEFEHYYPIRKPISPDLKLEKVLDKGIRRILEARLKEYDGDTKKAFSNLDENPIWLNKEKGISIKRVRIQGIANATALHTDASNQPVDFVNTGNNHHCAIFRDADGNLQEHIVSFFEATTRMAQGLPIIDKVYNAELGWQFLFTMKQNEYFVFPNPETGFSPADYDLTNPKNYTLVSKNLYRVQSITSKDYMLRHHLETKVEYPQPLKGITWKRIKSTSPLEGIVKVRVNHIGQIVAIGEY